MLTLLYVLWCEGENGGAYLPKASCGLMVEMCQRFLRAWRTVLEGALWKVEKVRILSTICQLLLEFEKCIQK